MNAFVLCVFGLFYSTQSASIPVTFNSKDNEIDDYPIYEDSKHLGERFYHETKDSSSILTSKWTSSSKVFPEELDENTEGNIMNPRRLTRSVLRDPFIRWPNKVIPYVISPSIGEKDRQMIYNAIEDFHRLTCLKFKERSPRDYDYVIIKNDPIGCYSGIGKTGGEQLINLQSPNCTTKKGSVIHEMLHTVGFVHEHVRPDRDKYVTINYDNIKRGKESEFNKLNADYVDNQGIGYDYKSVMHYQGRAFSKNGLPTIEAKMKGVTTLGQRDGFSEKDVQKVRKMYHCD